ncbi:cytokine receptor isoform X3 [Chironomus tepperi]|uniref:cytokine receptor isoform X3 n=1 Tax=Chironomus tepperi TaxID=113505 RepID=UPI00391F2F87
MCRTGIPKRMLHVVLLVFFIFFLICGIETYGIGVNPSVKYARVNDTFEISCLVPQSGGKLDFYDGDDLVPESYIKRLNDTCIVYVNSSTKPTKKNITCKREQNIIGLSEIYVEDKFAPVHDFKCRTNDLKNLTCTFQQPFSYHPITYRLSYTISNEEKFNCRLKPNMKGGYSCNITVIEDSLKSVFNFTLRGHTEFFKRRENFDIQLMETLLPKQIEHFDVQLPKPHNGTMSNKVFVMFSLPKYLESVAKEMMFEVKIKSEYDDEWERVIIKNFESNGYNEKKILTLTNIKFANTIYQLRFRIKTKVSEDTDEMWSPYIEKTFKTHPKLPENIPSVCNNCFNVMESGNIYLYWTEVPRFYQNGDMFSYFIKLFDSKTNELLNETFTTKTSLMISNRISYKVPHIMVHIYSSNHEGLSKKYVSVNVYGHKSKNFLHIKKEWIDMNVGYKLSWRPYDNIIDINNYTVVWCHQVSELSNKCDGPIKFLDLPALETQFYLNTSISHQFGVAVNTQDGIARGIQWAKCTSSKPDEIGTLHSIWATYFNENSILFNWELNCADKDIVSVYKIKYCVVADFDKKLCLEDEIYEMFKVNNNNKNTNLYQITNLKPYKIYNISISLISISGRSGAFSKPIMIRTLEGSPSAPQNLKTINVHSNSIDLQWNRPAEVNGPSLTYQLWYNERMIHIDNNETMNDTFKYRLNDLESFTNYTITVVACTRNCSQSSGSISQRTRVGKPGQINNIYSRYKNGSLELIWQKPINFGGYYKFYLLMVSRNDNYDEKSVFFKISSNRNSCIIHDQDCDKSYLNFFMRAVNVDYTKSGMHYSIINDSEDCFANKADVNEEGLFYGNPSVPLPHPCENSGILLSVINNPAFKIVFAFLLVLFIVWINVKLYKSYKKLQDMKDIEIVWPDGLDPKGTKDPKAESILTSVFDLDLIKTCNLEKIREESFKELELYENDRNSKEIEEKLCDESNRELLAPLFTKSQTLDVISNASINKPKSHSVPTTPLKQNPLIDNSSGYMQMHQPQKSPNKVSVGGYLDMSGKSSNPYINQSHMLNSKDIKSFIQDSQMNNGYIQRNSIKNSVPIKNSSGYVGFASFNKN